MSETTSRQFALLAGLVLFLLPFVLLPLLPHSHSGAHTDWQCLACQVGYFLVAVIFCVALLLGSSGGEYREDIPSQTQRPDATLVWQGPRGPPLTLV